MTNNLKNTIDVWIQGIDIDFPQDVLYLNEPTDTSVQISMINIE